MKFLFVNGPPIIKYGLAAGLTEAGEDAAIIDVPGNIGANPDYFHQQITRHNPDFLFVEGTAILKPHRELFPVLKESGKPLLFWAIDDPADFKTYSLPMSKRARHVFTPAEECLALYRSRHISASCLQFACLPSFHRRVKPVRQFSHDIVFVGNNYNRYRPRLEGLEIVLRPLLAGGFDVRVYGNQWWTDRSRPLYVPEQLYGGQLPYQRLPAAYSSAKIVLGIHSVNTSPTMMSMRTFEALGCGAFYLTQWTPAVENMFANHRHLVWSKTPEETGELVNYYLDREDLRRKIAACGQAEVYKRHTYRLRAGEMITHAKNFISNQG